MKRIILKEDKLRSLMKGMIEEVFTASSPYSEFYGTAYLDHQGLYEAICTEGDADYGEEMEQKIYDWCEDILDGVEVDARYYGGNIEVDLYGVKDHILSEINNCDMLDDSGRQRAIDWIENEFQDMEYDYEEYFNWEELTPDDAFAMDHD